MLGAAPSKTQKLRWVQRTQAPRTTRELRPFFCCSGAACHDLSHQSSNTISVAWGANCCSPTWPSREYQYCLAKGQDTRRWLIVSCSWSHKGQHSGQGRPRGARQSAFQHLSCSTNHKNLHFPGGPGLPNPKLTETKLTYWKAAIKWNDRWIISKIHATKALKACKD
jgi:hypothetical protein